MSPQVSFVGILPLAGLIVLAMGVVGLVLLRRGLRGRREGDHPTCRACGFDLFGLPQDQARCPECGGDLTVRGAVQVGHRRRRAGLAWGGAALLVMFALIVTTVGLRASREVNWQQVKPAAWLAREARSGDAAAWGELARRARTTSVRGERLQPIIADALAYQADASRKWVPQIGDFIEEAHAAGMVTDSDWRTYARQAPQLSLRWRAKVRKGDDLPGTVMFGTPRTGTSGKLSIRVEKPIDTQDPLAIRPRQDRDGGYSQQSLNGLGGGGSTSISLRLDPKKVAQAPLGTRTTIVQFTAEIRDQWDALTPLVEWTQDLAADWELVAADAQTVELVPDDAPELRTAMENGVEVTEIRVRPRQRHARGEQVSLDLKIAALPAPLAHDVFLRAGAREWKLASVTAAGPTRYGTGGHVPDTNPFDARRVDVIFRPSPAAARRTVDITRMWNGEIVVPDVEVTWPAARPATTPAR